MRRGVLVLAAALAVVLAVSAAGLFAWRSLNAPLAVDEPRVLFDVPEGASLQRVADTLAERGILSRPRVLTVYARLTGEATRIHAGEYALEPGMTALGLLEKLVAGNVHLHRLTVIEGWRFEDLLAALRRHPAVVSSRLDGQALMAELGKPDVHPEGQFLPDTYSFAKGTTDVKLLRRAHEALQARLAEAWRNRAADLQLETPYEALVLASIIEKETALDSERRLIAGVFNARLERGMRLQTDPTVIYGLGERFDGDLRSGDLAADTPYNTYTRHGLPPTPIALPSGASIDAAVNPQDSGALYFVATGRPDGSHHFSATLEEHNRAVQRYLERLRESQE